MCKSLYWAAPTAIAPNSDSSLQNPSGEFSNPLLPQRRRRRRRRHANPRPRVYLQLHRTRSRLRENWLLANQMSSAVERRDRRRLSDSPIDDHRPPSRRSSPRRERLPDHHRSPPRTRSPHRTSSRRARSPAKERLPDRARSPRKAPLSVPVRTSPSPSPRLDHKSSSRTRSPQRTSSSHRARSPAKERLPDRTRSPKHAVRTSVPGSPVPRTKRSRPTQEELEMEKLVDKEHVRKASRAEHDRGGHKEHGDEFEDQSEKRAKRNKIDDDSSRSLRRERSVSPAEPSHRNRYGSRSPPRVPKSGGRDEVREPRAAQEDMNGEDEAVARMKATEEALEAKQKQKPSFELSGKLAEETNRVRGITLLFTEPPDACKADTRWRLYVFKGGEALNEPLYVHRQTCYLFGRERRVADIPTDHPSCSKQHAVLQYRLVEKEQSDGLLSKQVRPYLMDLGSTNGSFINNNRIEPQRYYELFEQDTIKFGNSSREYVLLHENSAA